MAELKYDGDIVNSSVQGMSIATGKFTNLISAMQGATAQIVSARGFNEYIGGITADSFSSQVNDCQTVGDTIINEIRQTQVKILAYSDDEEEINAFLDSLDRIDYKNLDLTAIEDHIGWDRKTQNVLSGLVGDIAAGAAGFTEGLLEFGETGADLIITGGSSCLSLFTSLYDAANGSNYTDELQSATRALVSKKVSESVFNDLYADTEIGRWIKNNAYGFDTVRSVSRGLGYVTGMVALTAATGGAASVGLAGSVSAGNLALTAGAFGFGSGAERAWSEGATHSKGLTYAGASAAWEATQWYLGAKIAGIGGMGETSHISKGIFRSGAGARVGLNTLDGAAEGFVQPGLTMLYKDYEGKNIFEQYANAFEQNGGWDAVKTGALIGGFSSLLGEIGDARKMLKTRETDRAFEKSVLKMEPDADGLITVPKDFLKQNNIKLGGGRELKYDPNIREFAVYDGATGKRIVANDLFTPSGMYDGSKRVEYDSTNDVWRDRITGGETMGHPTYTWTDDAKTVKTHVTKGERKDGMPTGLHSRYSFIDKLKNGEIFLFEDGDLYVKKGTTIDFSRDPVVPIEIDDVIDNIDGSITILKSDSTSFRIEPNENGLVTTKWGYVTNGRKIKDNPGSTLLPRGWDDNKIRDSLDIFVNDPNKRPSRIRPDTGGSIYTYDFVNVDGSIITMDIQVERTGILSIYPHDASSISSKRPLNSYD